ncbi:MAG: type III polyketide synthase [Flavisolibacter sp.]
MSKIISIGTAVPAYKHDQMDILQFMQEVYGLDETEKRKIRYLYRQAGIKQRYSVIPDYSAIIKEWEFYPQSENMEPFPSLEKRMDVYNKQASLLSIDAIRNGIGGVIEPGEITHLVTISCTGMIAPGLDLQIVELMDLDKEIFRTSINFMGCYAAIHGLKVADFICKSDPGAKVVIVCTELCTLHFQRKPTGDNIASSLLFGDGSAAALITADSFSKEGLHLDEFHSRVIPKGSQDMAWELSSTGFLMSLSGYVPDLIGEDFYNIVETIVEKDNITINDISHWCIHPGGKRILEAIEKSLKLKQHELECSYDVLSEYGNMSSATILFVLKKILDEKTPINKLFGAAFGPGLTVETFTAHN